MSDGPGVVRTLYKSITSCSDHHTDEVIRRLHIETPVDDAVIRGASAHKVVIVTGNPGDGKTHLIRRVSDKFPESVRREVKTDANEIEDAEIIKSISSALEKKRGLVLAINEGILLEICERNRSRYDWAADIADRILRPFIYGEEPPRARNSRVLILDLNLRNCLGPTVAGAALEKVLGLVEADPAAAGPLLENVRRLRDETVRRQLLHLLSSIAQTGFHATMRDLLGFLAYIICAGEEEGGAPRHYAQNAFGEGQGPLFDRIRQLDPVRMPVPFLDDTLWNCQDVPEDWAVMDPGEYRSPGDRDAFVKRKRRAFFEHRKGQEIIRLNHQAVDREFSRLRRTNQSPEQAAVRLINNFFKPNAGSESLVLWVYHQYSVRPIRHLVSRQSVRSVDLRVAIPRLPESLAGAFPDFEPDHVVLHHREMPPGEGLIIDRRLIGMLLEGDRSTGLGTRNLEAQKKVAGFFDRLAPQAASQQVVTVLRLDNGVENQVGIDLENKTFFLPGG